MTFTKNFMVTKDQIIEDLIKTNTPVEIRGNEYYIQKNPSGSCDGCYFLGRSCPSRAVTICCSNGGNILKLKEQDNK